MIKYKLLCNDCELKFDSWFSSSSEYEKLKKRKLLICHNCNSEKVEKTLMAPAVMTFSKGGLMYEASIGGQKFTFKGY